MSAVRRDASVRPMFNGAFTEWSPTLGVSWHVVHVPEKDAGIVTPFENVWLFRPATPVTVIGFVLNSSSPRAMAVRAAYRSSCGGRAHAAKIVNARGSNAACVGLSPTGS